MHKFQYGFDSSQYENMSKEGHIQELTNINSSFVNDIDTKLSNLSKKIKKFSSKYEKSLTPIY